MRPNRIIHLLAVAVALLAGGVWVQESSGCLDCHEDRELTGKRNGRTIPDTYGRRNARWIYAMLFAYR